MRTLPVAKTSPLWTKKNWKSKTDSPLGHYLDHKGGGCSTRKERSEPLQTGWSSPWCKRPVHIWKWKFGIDPNMKTVNMYKSFILLLFCIIRWDTYSQISTANGFMNEKSLVGFPLGILKRIDIPRFINGFVKSITASRA